MTIYQWFNVIIWHLWVQGEEFDSKRPFGNSDWKHDILVALVKHGEIDGTYDSDFDIVEIDSFSKAEADQIIFDYLQKRFKRGK